MGQMFCNAMNKNTRYQICPMLLISTTKDIMPWTYLLLFYLYPALIGSVAITEPPLRVIRDVWMLWYEMLIRPPHLSHTLLIALILLIRLQTQQCSLWQKQLFFFCFNGNDKPCWLVRNVCNDGNAECASIWGNYWLTYLVVMSFPEDRTHTAKGGL